MSYHQILCTDKDPGIGEDKKTWEKFYLRKK